MDIGRPNNSKIGLKIRLVFTISFLILSFALIRPSANFANAQNTPYQVSGQIQANDAVYHLIYNVNVGDLVLVSITPIDGNPGYWSGLYYPNLTFLQSIGTNFPSSGYWITGAHSYQFVAAASGNYLLKFYTNIDAAFNYTIKSSNQVSGGNPLASTPNSVASQIGKSDTVYHTLFGTKTGDLVMVSVTPIDGNPGYWSTLYYPNMTIFRYIGTNFPSSGYWITGAHSYGFIAAADGNYLLKVYTNANNAFNYTVRSSASLSSGSSSTPTITPTPTQTPSSQISSPTGSSTTPTPTSGQTSTQTTIHSGTSSTALAPTATSTSEPAPTTATTDSATSTTSSTQSTTQNQTPTSFNSTYNPNPTTQQPSNSNQTTGNTSPAANYTLPIAIAVIAICLVIPGGALVFIRNRKHPEDPKKPPPIPSIGWDHVFISYVEEDQKIAKEIADGIEKAGYKTWYYERDSMIGVSFVLTTSQAIKQSRAVVLIISRDSLRSNEVNIEIATTHRAGKRFFPVLNDVSYDEFQRIRPEWALILGTIVSMPISRNKTSEVVSRIASSLGKR